MYRLLLQVQSDFSLSNNNAKSSKPMLLCDGEWERRKKVVLREDARKNIEQKRCGNGSLTGEWEEEKEESGGWWRWTGAKNHKAYRIGVTHTHIWTHLDTTLFLQSCQVVKQLACTRLAIASVKYQEREREREEIAMMIFIMIVIVWKIVPNDQ